MYTIQPATDATSNGTATCVIVYMSDQDACHCHDCITRKKVEFPEMRYKLSKLHRKSGISGTG